jgi:hypothetical protein
VARDGHDVVRLDAVAGQLDRRRLHRGHSITSAAKLDVVAKVWVLDTETKGTGAQMVPLEKTLRQPASEPARRRAPVPKPRPKERPPEPTPPRRFRVIDARSRELLADDANAPETIELLRQVEQPVDVSVYVWEPRPETWRLLTSREKSLLWEFRQRRPAQAGPRAPAR